MRTNVDAMAASHKQSRAVKVSKEIARVRFIDSAIELIGTQPLALISDQMFTDQAGLHRSAFYRCFKSRFDFLDEVAHVLTQKWLVVVNESILPGVQERDINELTLQFVAPLVARSEKIFEIGAYLNFSNYSSPQLRANFQLIIDVWAQRFELKLSPRMARATAYKIFTLGLARSIAIQLADIPTESVIDTAQLVISEIRNHLVIEQELGWNAQ